MWRWQRMKQENWRMEGEVAFPYVCVRLSTAALWKKSWCAVWNRAAKDMTDIVSKAQCTHLYPTGGFVDANVDSSTIILLVSIQLS